MDNSEQNYLKKIVIIFIILSLVSLPVFSKFIDSFSFLENYESYSLFIKAIKNNEAQPLCSKLYEKLDFSSSSLIEKSVLEIKTKLNYSRYLIENNQKSKAEILLKEAEIELQNIKTHEIFYNLLEAESKSLWYLINHFKYLSKAVKATNLTKSNFKSYSNEISAVLQYANLLLYTPGKDPSEALKIFKTIENENLQVWDLFSLYSGLGISYFKLKNSTKALLYLSQAKNIYVGDELINKTLLKLK